MNHVIYNYIHRRNDLRILKIKKKKKLFIFKVVRLVIVRFKRFMNFMNFKSLFLKIRHFVTPPLTVNIPVKGYNECELETIISFKIISIITVLVFFFFLHFPCSLADCQEITLT